MTYFLSFDDRESNSHKIICNLIDKWATSTPLDHDYIFFDEWIFIKGAKVNRDNGSLLGISFPSEQHYLQFLLKN